MSGRVAFVFYPHLPNQARLETMPFAFQTVRTLAQLGWLVDVFLWQDNTDALTDTVGGRIRFRIPGLLEQGSPKRSLPLLHALRYGLPRAYDCVFGLGQIGIHIARSMSLIARCPLVYLNDELPSCWPPTVWTRLERQAAARADFLVSPDLKRNTRLLQELDLSEDTPNGALFNTPIIEGSLPKIDWYQRLGIPPGKHIVLHAGSVEDWAQIPEVLVSVPTWPHHAVLLIHSRGSDAAEKYRSSLSHLQVDGRVFWSEAPLSARELHSLIAVSTACLGLYRNTGPNIELVGYSSGKILRSLVCGTPVIASSIPSLDFVTANELGMQVSNPLEIAEHLPRLVGEREVYRERCLKFATSEISFGRAWEEFSAAVNRATGLDLLRPGGVDGPH